MKIPNFTHEEVVNKDGHFTDTWRNIFSQLLQQLQGNFSNENGLVTPPNTTANITQLTNKNGAMFYDTDTHQMKVCVDGHIKTFNLS